LDWATKNGARSLGLEEELGSIESGKLADLIIIDLTRPHLVPAINPVSNLVHYGEMADVESVMVAGELIMSEGKVLTMDEDEVVANARQATVRSWSRLKEQFPDIAVPDYAGWEALEQPG
jgi:5-methylthioadenosine/S-adenosylhomocysteine deaminase